MSSITMWRSYFNVVFHQSATVVLTGNTGIIATPGVVHGGQALFPMWFLAVGTNQLTDETNVLTIDWYGDSTGRGGSIGTTTFDIMSAPPPASNAEDFEAWPGDVTAWNAARDMVPLPPFHKITHTLVGTTKSMEYTILISYTQLS